MTTDSNIAQWKQELRSLLEKVQNQPSSDLTETRDRIAVLNRLIAGAGERVGA